MTAAKLSVSSLDAISANVGTLTAGVIRNSADTYRNDVTNGRTITQIGSYMRVEGAPFGSASQFIEWYGPYFASLANCTEANALAYLKTDGSLYHGGLNDSPKVTRTYRAQGTTMSLTETVPLGVTRLVIEIFGAGGGGGAGTGGGSDSGGGGGSGAYVRTTVNATPGNTFTVSLAPIANGGSAGGNGADGASSTISGSTITTMTAPGGGGGRGTTAASAAGAAAATGSGGTDSNLGGIAGTAGGATSPVAGGAGRNGFTEIGASGGAGSSNNINTGPGQSGDNFFAILGFRVGAQAVFRYF